MDDTTGYELTASVVLWRGDEILVMKRAGGFSAGGWFMPGGHLEPGERPAEAAAREVLEETGIAIDPASLAIVDVMTYEADGATAHSVIYNGACPDGAECVINEEHVYHRWMAPEAYIARFLDGDALRAKGVPERAIALADEVARVVRAAARTWRQKQTGSSSGRRTHRPGDPIDEATIRKQHESIRRVVESLQPIYEEILARRGGQPFTVEEIDDLLGSVIEDRLNRLMGVEEADDDGAREYTGSMSTSHGGQHPVGEIEWSSEEAEAAARSERLGRVLERIRRHHEEMLTARGGTPVSAELIDSIIDEVRGRDDADLD